MCFPRIACVCILGNVPSSIAQKCFQTTRCLQNAAKLILSQATLFIKGTNQINQHLPFIKTGTANQKYCFNSEHSFYNTSLAKSFYRDKGSYISYGKKNQSRRMHDVRFSWSCRWDVLCNQRKEGLWHHCCRAEMAGGGVNTVLAIDPWRTFGLWPGPSLCFC